MLSLDLNSARWPSAPRRLMNQMRGALGCATEEPLPQPSFSLKSPSWARATLRSSCLNRKTSRGNQYFLYSQWIRQTLPLVNPSLSKKGTKTWRRLGRSVSTVNQYSKPYILTDISTNTISTDDARFVILSYIKVHPVHLSLRENLALKRFLYQAVKMSILL